VRFTEPALDFIQGGWGDIKDFNIRRELHRIAFPHKEDARLHGLEKLIQALCQSLISFFSGVIIGFIAFQPDIFILQTTVQTAAPVQKFGQDFPVFQGFQGGAEGEAGLNQGGDSLIQLLNHLQSFFSTTDHQLTEKAGGFAQLDFQVVQLVIDLLPVTVIFS